MTIPVQAPPAYEPPPPDECVEVIGPIVLALNHELRARYVMWQERYMVEFAVVQIALTLGKWQEVARIDTCHDEVHKHQLKRGSSDTVGVRTPLAPIPPIGGWEVVDEWYDRSLTLMKNEWEENLRRWGGDSEY